MLNIARNPKLAGAPKGHLEAAWSGKRCTKPMQAPNCFRGLWPFRFLPERQMEHYTIKVCIVSMFLCVGYHCVDLDGSGNTGTHTNDLESPENCLQNIKPCFREGYRVAFSIPQCTGSRKVQRQGLRLAARAIQRGGHTRCAHACQDIHSQSVHSARQWPITSLYMHALKFM